MRQNSSEETDLTALYEIDARHEADLKKQFERISEFESAAASGDWNLFKKIVNSNGGVLLKLMRRSDGDPRLRLPLFQSGELEERFTMSLQELGKDWTHLMPWWARLGYRFEIPLTWFSALLVLGAFAAVFSGNPGVGGALGGVALAVLVIVDNSEPRLRGYSRWWVRFVYPKPKSILSRWRTGIYVFASLTIIWFLMADTFKTPQEYCDGLSPADIAALSGCTEVLQGDQ